MSNLLSVILDVVVLMALGGTIYYAMRLSNALDNFRTQRSELKSLIADLGAHIDEAQNAIAGLKKASDVAADNLDDVVHDAKRMAQELKLINEASDAMADRLERVAIARSGGEYHDPRPFEEDLEKLEKDFAGDEDIVAPSFFIQDSHFDEEEDVDWGDEQGGEGFASQAEKDLYEALQKNKHKASGGRV